jgi:hypothetical protein
LEFDLFLSGSKRLRNIRKENLEFGAHLSAVTMAAAGFVSAEGIGITSAPSGARTIKSALGRITVNCGGRLGFTRCASSKTCV